ncbi:MULTISPECIES: hypothetical protein [unclassified Moorena]|uniref:hypothetical protein n=1 Tax=unclassified Moorena TaxID=2683338 RepID=UPI0013B6BA81|nr:MULTISPECIES: hypothetical protein [unclassified Moorena]NEQ06646.1 hypothetical protein [Moorena sp. SIO4E2]NEQ13400.1 hypothetical protein [Moorena sp. SIO3E2]NER91764.1 hypothetical protein [Moorena sp. SIO3A2]NES41804.1 hypothetical protein [Moorena sp. SIO2C4]
MYIRKTVFAIALLISPLLITAGCYNNTKELVEEPQLLSKPLTIQLVPNTDQPITAGETVQFAFKAVGEPVNILEPIPLRMTVYLPDGSQKQLMVDVQSPVVYYPCDPIPGEDDSCNYPRVGLDPTADPSQPYQPGPSITLEQEGEYRITLDPVPEALQDKLHAKSTTFMVMP